MSSGTQVELDWAGPASPNGGVGQAHPTSVSNGNDGASTRQLTDEEILGIDPTSPSGGFGGQARLAESGEGRQGAGDKGGQRESSSSGGTGTPRNDDAHVNVGMPAWMQTMAGDPQHGAEAQQLWQEHQEFRAAFASPDEARAIKELFPGGAQEARTLRQAAQAVDQIDAAIYSGDTRAQSEVVAELARANPAAFRSLFAEAAKVLAGLGNTPQGSATLRENREGWGTQQTFSQQNPAEAQSGRASHASQPLTTSQSSNFDPAAYASFERSTNDVVARDVRSTITDTLTRVLPEGVAEGAARRIGEDIFNEVHRALAADRTLSEQVGDALRDRRFGTAEQQRVASLLAGRARQLVPSVARRVIGEWTSSVLGTARNKAARQASAASRVDIAAPGGSLDSMPLRAMSPREVNYASMSDDEILSL